jgi:hypothetical protein
MGDGRLEMGDGETMDASVLTILFPPTSPRSKHTLKVIPSTADG